MKLIGLIYPINGKTELRRQELKESGEVFAAWLTEVGGFLGWKVYDYSANNDQDPPDAVVYALVVFGKVSKKRLSFCRHIRDAFFQVADYESNLDMLRDLFRVLNSKER